MGHMRAHALVVSSWDPDAISEAHLKAIEILGRHSTWPHGDLSQLVSNVVAAVMNGGGSFSTFFVAPDGSKEWWPTSDAADAARAELIGWLREGGHLDWCLVQFGDDDGDNLMLANDADGDGAGDPDV